MKPLLGGARGKRGESLTEVLVAVTIGGLALIILAMAISTASHMATQSRNAMNDYYAANNEAITSDAASVGTGTVTLTQESGGSGSALVPLVSSGESLDVTYHENAEAGAAGVILYDSSGSGS